MELDRFCQSCHIPKRSNKFTAGTEKDGSVNGDYCSLCYDAGKFLNQDTIKTAQDMQKMVRKQLKKKGFSKVKRWFYTIEIPRLGRWQKIK